MYFIVGQMLESLDVGWDDRYPSSMRQFIDWYVGVAGYQPFDEEFALWAIFDVLESEAYRAAKIPKLVRDGYLDAEDVMALLVGEYMSLLSRG